MDNILKLNFIRIYIQGIVFFYFSGKTLEHACVQSNNSNTCNFEPIFNNSTYR